MVFKCDKKLNQTFFGDIIQSAKDGGKDGFQSYTKKATATPIRKKNEKTGRVYHHHWQDIIVTRKELLIQLRDADCHDNLLTLLIYGRSLPDYEVRLTRAAIKFEFLGSLQFPVGDSGTSKFKSSVYVKELFQGRYETIDEVKERIYWITKREVSDEFAKRIFRKLVFVINTCCPLMAEVSEVWWGGTYRELIEYAIGNDSFPFPEGDNIIKLFPRNVPRYQTRTHILSQLPENLAHRIVYGESIENNFRN